MATLFSPGNEGWIALAVIWFVIYGVGAPASHWRKEKADLHSTSSRAWWWFYQGVFNGLGAAIGWVCLYFLWYSNLYEFSVAHFVALAVAFLGITGNLPQVALRLQGTPK